MSSMIGKKLKISLFGESHGQKIGCVIDGLKPGIKIPHQAIRFQLDRRKPGGSKQVTQRKEKDDYEIVSGVFNEYTTGTPLCALFSNTDTRSQDYEKLQWVPRPGHADYTGYIKYDGYNDPRGGGHFSARLTAPLVFAGALIGDWLKKNHNIDILCHIKQMGDVTDEALDPLQWDEKQKNAIYENTLPMIDPNKVQKAHSLLENIKAQTDSVGALIETAIYHIPPGWGNPIFESIESILSSYVFSIPGVKSISFGNGANMHTKRGSQTNDPFYIDKEQVKTKTNEMGGILGGISNGMPIIYESVLKPTPSIGKAQSSVDLKNKCQTSLSIKGRHDPCIGIRGTTVFEAMTALAVYEFGEV